MNNDHHNQPQVGSDKGDTSMSARNGGPIERNGSVAGSSSSTRAAAAAVAAGAGDRQPAWLQTRSRRRRSRPTTPHGDDPARSLHVPRRHRRLDRLPPTPAIPAVPPRSARRRQGSRLTTYIFGFRNITELDAAQRSHQKNKAQHSAPLFWVKEYDPNDATEFVVDITNLGLAQRPDLFDAHTLHWHGFRNVIPFFDGEPTGSVSVPAGTCSATSTDPATPARTCTTATSKTSSTCTWA